MRDADPELVVRRLCGTAYHIVPGHERHVLARDIDCLAADSQWQPWSGPPGTPARSPTSPTPS
ncbi:hypothetical protein NWF32_26255 [Pseudomonas qingdaonensis]|nr:hypothetical protein [Pseudomonas qingdaonensis]